MSDTLPLAAIEPLAPLDIVIADALLAIGAVGFCAHAPVTFKSGIVSPVYCDNRRFPFHPSRWLSVIRGFASLIERETLPAEIIGGIEAAGIPHSAALGFHLAQPSIFIRKEAKSHGTKKRVEGGDVAGRNVLLVEDLVTTGLSSLSGVAALRDEGAVVTDCVAIISYGFREATEAFAAAGVRLHTLTSFPVVLRRARASGALSEVDAALVSRWLVDPHGWAAAQNAGTARA